jgi:hypothetical protein
MLPHHPWGLINALGLVYLLLIGPLAMALFRKRIRKIRWVLAYLCGIIALFSLLFLTIGKRGYGEIAGGIDWIYARVLGPEGDRAYLRAWSQVFVTDSGTYELRFGDGSHQFHIPNQGSGLEATAREGAEASLGIRLPVFSSAGFERESVQACPPFRVEDLGGRRFRIQSAMDLNPEGFALVDGMVCDLKRQANGEWVLGPSGKPWTEAWLSDEYRYHQLTNVYGRHTDSEDPENLPMARQLAAMAGMDLPQVHGQNARAGLIPRADTGTHLFLVATPPDAWLFRHADLRMRSSSVLLHADLTALEIPRHVP